MNPAQKNWMKRRVEHSLYMVIEADIATRDLKTYNVPFFSLFLAAAVVLYSRTGSLTRTVSTSILHTFIVLIILSHSKWNISMSFYKTKN